jgi:hypothetical protein
VGKRFLSELKGPFANCSPGSGRPRLSQVGRNRPFVPRDRRFDPRSALRGRIGQLGERQSFPLRCPPPVNQHGRDCTSKDAEEVTRAVRPYVY